MGDDERRMPDGFEVALKLLMPISILAALASPFLVIAIPFLFDAPGSENNRILWRLAGGLLALPFASIASAVCAWLALHRGSTRLFSAAFAIALGWLVYMTAVNYVLDANCGGSFACTASSIAP
jgi:hypothetical protein